MAGIAAPRGPYLLRRLVAGLPLSPAATPQEPAVRITTVDVWNGNLYVGTSAAELLHLVLLPPESTVSDIDSVGEPTAVLASRLAPPHHDATGPGVQHVLLLPRANKACVLCNNTLSVYALPELSPDSAFKPIACLWVGGVDLNPAPDNGYAEGVVVVIGLKKRLRLVRMAENQPPRALKAIEYAGCLLSVRRDAFSCAADAHAYALLDMENQQKIGLFPISSLDPNAGDVGGAAEHLPSRRHEFDVPESLSRDRSPAAPLSALPVTGENVERDVGQTKEMAPDKPLPPPPEVDVPPKEETRLPAEPVFVPLKPLIASPTPNEFLLTVGTTPAEQGVGMFVNLDGDLCRGSIQFSSYPDAIVTDGTGIDLSASSSSGSNAEEGYVLAVVHQEDAEGIVTYGVEVQRWDVDPSAGEAEKDWVDFSALDMAIPDDTTRMPMPIGMRTVVQPYDLILPEIGAKLSTQRLQLTQTSLEEAPSVTATQTKADRDFTDRLSKLQAQTVIWTGDQIWWIVRSPLMTRLDARIEEAQYTSTGDGRRIQPNPRLLASILGDIRGQEPRNESEYLSLIYVRQKASLMLFMDIVLRTKTNIIITESDKRIAEQALIEGEIDPRVVLSLLPILSREVVQGPEGIQISAGITAIVEQFLLQNNLSTMATDVSGPFGDNLLHFVKRYLQFWKRRKGMASVTSDPFVFRAVDAALLHILLLLDQSASSPDLHRAELNELVDKEVECFDRAIELLEQFKRLFLLSRLYQSNCKASLKASKVLATWKRVIQGEEDKGGELVDGEQKVREYLARIRDQSLVEEYGTWLANRNPELGVQVFADDQSRVKFEPTHAVALLREKAPGAVKEYLEYLVFGKKHTQYVNELITFYLSTVITELESSAFSRETLSQTYETYRILEPPKPTYHAFITDNASSEEWWQARLRLLQLLGQTSSYDVASIVSRLQPYEQQLVPEMIILNGRQECHEEALRLLTHGLGDYSTAMNYCLYGYASIFRPPHNPSSSSSSSSPTSLSSFPCPPRPQQSHLFTTLFHEFLRINDLSQRVERTGELLERFGAWLDTAHVLATLPDEWSVHVLSGYLIHSLRRLVREKAEAGMLRALSDAQNCSVGADLVARREEGGAVVVRE